MEMEYFEAYWYSAEFFYSFPFLPDDVIVENLNMREFSDCTYGLQRENNEV
jgi:hypothetical protein